MCIPPIRLLIVLAVILITSNLAHADFIEVGPFNIIKLGTDFTPNEGLIIYPEPGTSIPTVSQSGCPASDGYGLTKLNNAAYSTLSATVMAAFLANKKIKLWYDHSPYVCAVGRVAFVGLEIVQ